MVEWKQPAFFVELLVILTASLISILACRRLRVPDLLAFLLSGAIIGPHGLDWVRDSDNIHFISDLGVSFLLFELGLEFSLPRLLQLKRPVLGLGSLQILLTTAALSGIMLSQDYPALVALVIGAALAMSSTAIVAGEFHALNWQQQHHARVAVGVLLFQDIAAVLLLILLPVLGGTEAFPDFGLVALALGRALLLVAILQSVAYWGLPRVYREVAKTGSQEVFVLTTLVIVLLTGFLTHAVGLSMAFGAFSVGVMLGESEFRQQVELDIRPFRDLLMGLFFAGIGMKLDFATHLGEWPSLLACALLLVLCKTLLTTLSALLIGEPFGSAAQTGLALAQAGEFGFALIALATEAGLLTPGISARVLLVAIASMTLSPFLIRNSRPITEVLARLAGRQASLKIDASEENRADLKDHVILAGYGRVGQMVAKFLNSNGIPFIALDIDAEQVKLGRATGDAVIYGSCGRIDMLRRCHIDCARLAILTFKSLKEAQRVIGQIRALGYHLPIIVRTRDHGDCIALVNAGADQVVPEMFEASLLMAAEALAMLGMDRAEIERQLEDERQRHTEGASGPFPKRR